MVGREAIVRVELSAQRGVRGYDVRIAAGELDDLGPLSRRTLGSRPKRALLLHDAGVPRADLDRALRSLGGAQFDCAALTIVPRERDKSLGTLQRVLEAMDGANLDRLDPVVALGGGIVGDVGGFAAAVYRRGVPVVQCPTTLLAMVDASVGGKTGVNLASGSAVRKNMVGAFHQPALVLADVRVLRSLEDRVFAAGLAECVKHALLGGAFGDGGLLEWLEERAAAGGAGSHSAWDERTLVELVSRNVRIKAQVVEGDETESAESGGRALLNLGHTFAHAIEPLEGVGRGAAGEEAPLLHGEAVALGLVAACRLASELGRAPAELEARVERLLRGLGLPTGVSGLPDTAWLVEAMSHDKKVLGGSVRVIAPAAPGRCEVIADPPAGALARAWEAIRAERG